MKNNGFDKSEILSEALRISEENVIGEHYVRVFWNVDEEEVIADVYADSLTDVVDTTGYILLTEFTQQPLISAPFMENWIQTDEGKKWLQERKNEIVYVLNEI